MGGVRWFASTSGEAAKTSSIEWRGSEPQACLGLAGLEPIAFRAPRRGAPSASNARPTPTAWICPQQRP